MKVRDLIDKKIILEIDGITETELESKVKGLAIHTEDENRGIKAHVADTTIHNGGTKDSLEVLGYSFEVGV